MLPGYSKKTNFGIGISFALTTVFLVLVFKNPLFLTSWSCKIILGVSAISFVWGCCMYAQGKGYNPLWGLLGLGNIVGLLILALFPDKHRTPFTLRGCLVAVAIILSPFIIAGIFIFRTLNRVLSPIDTKNRLQSEEIIKKYNPYGDNEIGHKLRANRDLACDSKMSLSIRQYAVQSLTKIGTPSIPAFQDVLKIIRQKESHTSDDQVIIKNVEEQLTVMGAPFTTETSTPAVSQPIVSTVTVAPIVQPASQISVPKKKAVRHRKKKRVR